jgi:hypothetical protein
MPSIIDGVNHTIGSIFQFPLEMFRILPNSIVTMAGAFAILTLSFPYAVFFGSLLEALGIYSIFQSIVLQLNVYDVLWQRPINSSVCYSSLNGVSLNELVSSKSSVDIGFPSYPIFIISFACMYIFGMYQYLQDEINALGDDYKKRYNMSIIFIGCLIAITCVVRMMFSCDGMGVIVFSIILGIAAGFIVLKQNDMLFGKEGLNLLGIPILRGKAVNGQALYICPMT